MPDYVPDAASDILAHTRGGSEMGRHRVANHPAEDEGRRFLPQMQYGHN